MLTTLGMWTLALGLTLAEEFISARRTTAFTGPQRPYPMPYITEGGQTGVAYPTEAYPPEQEHHNRRRAWQAVRWGGLFEIVLCLDIWFISRDYWLAIPIVVGAMLGAWIAVRRQREMP